MKRIIILFISTILVFCLAACGADNTGGNRNNADNKSVSDVYGTEPAEDFASAEKETETTGAHILIAYFSVPEDVDTSGVDAVAGASIVVREEGVMGNTEYVAKVIQSTVGGDLFRIETTDQYPLDHELLVDHAAAALYFLEEYDFGGKTIIPFVTHGGSGFSDTRNTIAGLQPDAQVSDNVLSLSRGDVASSKEDVISWAESLSIGE